MKQPILRIPLYAGLLSIITAVLSGCATPSPPPSGASETSHLARVREEGKIVMLSVPHQESAFVRTNLELGPMKRVANAEHFQGIDIEIVEAFAESLGVQLEVRPAVDEAGVPAYSELIPALLREEGDLIASSFTINEKRRKEIDFTQPYFTVFPAVVTLQTSLVTSPEDLHDKTASVIRGTSLESHLRGAGFGDDRLEYVAFQFEGFASVIEGQADFTLQDSPTAKRLVVQYPELKIACAFSDSRDSYGIGIPKDSDLRTSLDSFLEKFQESGELDKVLKRWQMPVGN